MKLRNWKIEDANGNSITVVAPSRTQAKKQYKQMLPSGRVVTITDVGEARQSKKTKIPLSGVEGAEQDFRPVGTIRNDAKKQKPNDPCSCGSGKKFKRCCFRTSARK